MQGVVAKRRLRKSCNVSINPDFQIEERIIENVKRSEKKEKSLNGILESKKLQNLSIRICIATFVIFLIVLYKSYFTESLKDNNIIKEVEKQYSKNYTWEQICEFAFTLKDTVVKDFNDIVNKFNTNAIVPASNNQVNIYSENNDIKENNTVEDLENQVKENESTKVEEEKYEEAVSAVSLMDQDVQDILNQKITFIPPANGVVTSRFGVREVTDPVVTPYHTGLDIANAGGTNIVSSIDGTVSAVGENQYYGKFVEVEKNGIITKYAHMSQQLAKKGQVVKSGDVIGKMGKTGMATGNHVHLEIKINGRVVDPEIFVKV